MNHEMLMKGVDILFRLFEVVIIPLLAFAIAKYVKDSRIRGALSVLNEQALLSVQRLNKTRRELKDPSKPGEWTDQQAANLRDAARREVRQALGDSLSILIEQYGGTLKVDKLIEHAIDAHAESTRPAAGGTPTPSQPPAAPPPSTPPALPLSEPAPPSGDSNGET